MFRKPYQAKTAKPVPVHLVAPKLIRASDIKFAIAKLDKYQSAHLDMLDESRAVDAIKRFSDLIGGTDTPLTGEQYRKLKDILMDTRDVVDDSYASVFLQFFKNLLGLEKTAATKKDEVKKISEVKKAVVEIKAPFLEEKKLPVITRPKPKVKKVSPVRRLATVPEQIDLQDLDDDGNLIVTHREQIEKIIIDIVAGKSKYAKQRDVGRISKERLEKIIGEKPNCGAFFKFNKKTNEIAIYWLYKGRKHPFKNKKIGRLVGCGGNGSVKAAQKSNNEYCVNKMQEDYGDPKIAIDDEADISIAFEIDDLEFKISEKLGLAEASLIRKSPSATKRAEKAAFHHETILKWIPGLPLDKVVEEENLPPLFLLEVIVQAINALVEFHKKGYLHCDVKLENFIKSITDVVLIDYGHARPRTAGKTDFEKELRAKNYCGTVGYRAPELLEKNVIMSEKTDLYSLALACAEILEFISAESQAEEQRVATDSELEKEKKEGAKKAEPKISEAQFMRNGGLKLCKKSSDEFKENKVIENIRDRREIHDHINSILGNPDDRPKAEAISKFFNKQYNKLLSKITTHVCLISIDEFLAATSERQKQFLDEASDYGMTWLIEFDEHTPKQEIEISRIFAERHIFLGKDIVRVDKSMKDFRKHLEMSAAISEPGKSFEFTFLTDRLLSVSKKNILEEQNIKDERLNQPLRYTRSSATLFANKDADFSPAEEKEVAVIEKPADVKKQAAKQQAGRKR